MARVVADLTGKTDQLDGLTRIGIDEITLISLSKGHRYLTGVVDYDTGRLVWAHEGRNQDTLTKFFRALGESRSALLTHVSADGAGDAQPGAHTADGLDAPGCSEVVRRALSGIRRIRATQPTRRAPLLLRDV